MSSRELHNVGLHTDWDLGEDGWKAGMDRNLLRLDTLVQARVLGVGENSPPPSPSEGDVYIVGESPTGVWSEYPHHVAVRDADDWAFIAPGVEWTVRNIGDGREYRFTGTRWVNDSTFVTALPNIAALTSLNTEALVDGQQFSVKDGGQVRKFAWDEQAGDFQELTYAIRKPLSVEPTLSSNFRTGEHKLYGVQDGYKSRDLADIWDVTRASGETVLTPAGRIATVDPDTLPLTYVPETGGLGAQVYGAVTNLLLWSQNLLDPAWNIGNLDVVRVSSEDEGPLEAHSVAPGTETSATFPAQGLTLEDGVFTGSVFIRPTTATWLRIRSTFQEAAGLWVDLENKDFGTSGGPVEGLDVTEMSNGILRIDFQYTLGTGGSGSLAFVPVGGNGSTTLTGEYLFYGAQLSRTATVLPYVKTEASTVTKPATNVVRELGEEASPESGIGFFIDCNGLGSDESTAVKVSESLTSTNGVVINSTPSGLLEFRMRTVSGAYDTFGLTNEIPRGQPFKAMVWVDNDVAFVACNGQFNEISHAQDLSEMFNDARVFFGGQVAGGGREGRRVNGTINEFYLITKRPSQAEAVEQTRGGS